MSLSQKILQLYFENLAAKNSLSTMEPEQPQIRALKKIAKIYGREPFVRRLGFHSEMTPHEMKTLPQTEYTSYLSEIEPVLSTGKGSHFNTSSLACIASTTGTTSLPKKFPINKNYLKSYRRFVLALNASYLKSTEQWSSLVDGKTLMLSASPSVQKTPGGLIEGYISGVMAMRTPWVYRNRLLPSKSVLMMSDWDEKIDAIIAEAKNQNVISISGMPALTLIFSQKMVEKLKISSLREVWPNLGVLLFGGSGLSPFMKEQFDSLWGATLQKPNVYWESLAATEGQIGHTWDVNRPGMIFNVFENFYQFQSEDGSIHHLHELQVGQKYALLMTTLGGLINYRMSDWIKITSVRPFMFVFAGRDREEISLGMERITFDQIHSTIAEVAKRLKKSVPEFVFWIKEGKPYQIFCGIGESISVDAPTLAILIDQVLGEKNEDYQDMRKQEIFYGPLQVQLFPDQMFKNYRSRNVNKGQFKPKQIFKTEADFRKEYL